MTFFIKKKHIQIVFEAFTSSCICKKIQLLKINNNTKGMILKLKNISILVFTIALSGCGNSHLECDTPENKKTVQSTVDYLISQYLGLNKNKSMQGTLHENSYPTINITSFNQQEIDANAKRCFYQFDAVFELEDKYGLKDSVVEDLEITFDFRSTEKGEDTHLVEDMQADTNEMINLGLTAIKVNTLITKHEAEKAEEEALKAGIGAYKSYEYTEAFKILKPLADKNNPDASYYVAMMLRPYMIHESYGIKADKNKYIYYIKKASEEGHIDAQLALANSYRSGYGVKKDTKEFKRLATLAWKQGSLEAKTALGIHYLKSGDISQGETLLIEAGEEGFGKAFTEVGRIYQNGKHVAQDYIKALELYKKAAENGDDYAYRLIGYLYLDPKMAKPKPQVAIEWFLKEDIRGYRNIAGMYFDGKGVEKSFEDGVKWYEKGHQKTGNNIYPLLLGHKYYRSSDFEKARHWYTETINSKSKTSMVRSNNDVAYRTLARMNYKGIGGAKNYDLAFQYANKSISHYESKRMLGAMYLFGKGVEQDVDKGLKLLKHQYLLRDAQAQIILGNAYLDGQLVEQDFKLAKKHFEAAAKKKSKYAYQKLGEIYENGLGVKSNKKIAKYYYDNAKKIADG